MGVPLGVPSRNAFAILHRSFPSRNGDLGAGIIIERLFSRDKWELITIHTTGAGWLKNLQEDNECLRVRGKPTSGAVRGCERSRAKVLPAENFDSVSRGGKGVQSVAVQIPKGRRPCLSLHTCTQVFVSLVFFCVGCRSMYDATACTCVYYYHCCERAVSVAAPVLNIVRVAADTFRLGTLATVAKSLPTFVAYIHTCTMG